jgi:hypothetical protein
MQKTDTAILLCNREEQRRGSVLRRLALFSLLVPLIFGMVSCDKLSKTEAGPQAGPKTNTPPSISSVKILPERPTKENELNVMVQCNDQEGDTISYQFQWLKNDREIFGETKSVLASGSFERGDVIQVKVVAIDGKNKGEAAVSPPVKIANTPPAIQEVSIEPDVAYANTPLKALVQAVDPDRDFVAYSYQWEKNGVALPEENGETLEPGRFKKGDSISVAVVPDDQEAQGILRRSDPVLISNSPPAIVSSPPATIEGPPFLYQYPVKATDIDQDTVIYSLKSGPKGMEIDKNTGLIRWEVRREDQGTHTIEVEAKDDAGAKSLQRYTLSVEFK